jgi:hypothetical protein
MNVDAVRVFARKYSCFNALISLICFGTSFALQIDVNQESQTQVNALYGEAMGYAAVQLGVEDVKRIRHVLHELANVFTGMMVTGGLLHQALKGDLRQRYTGEICTGGDRGAELVREAREVLMKSEESARPAVENPEQRR